MSTFGIAVAAGVITQLGWEGADMESARAARAIEPLAVLWCIPGFRSDEWDNRAVHVLRR